jgi:hypothetical protein
MKSLLLAYTYTYSDFKGSWISILITVVVVAAVLIWLNKN